MYVGVLRAVNLKNVLEQTLTTHAVAFVVGNLTEGRGGIATDHACATVRDTAVGVGLSSA